MLQILLLMTLAVALGGLLGLTRHAGPWLAPLRVFGIVAVAGIVLLHLLPDALQGGGVLALLLAVGAAALPMLWPRIPWRKKSPDMSGRITLELAYVALLVHKVADGIALGFGLGHDMDARWGLVAGFAAHTIPMTAVIAITFAHRGQTHAWARVGGVALAIIFGVALADQLQTGPLLELRPYFDALTAGLLLHLTFHDVPRPALRPMGYRLGELFAVLAGLAVTWLGLNEHGQLHDHGDHNHGHLVEANVLDSLGHLALDMAPMLALGLILGALVQAFAGALPVRWLKRDSDLSSAMRGAVIGAPLPICSCGVLPVTQALVDRGVGPAAAVAFLFATPELGPDTLVITGQLFGWPWAIARVVAAVALAILGGWMMARLVRRVRSHAPKTIPPRVHENDPKVLRVTRLSQVAKGQSSSSAHSCESCGHDHLAPLETPIGPWHVRFGRALFELIEHSGPWMALGLVAAAYVDALLPAAGLSTLPVGVDLLVVTVVSIPAYVCASSATPLAAVLVMKGLSPGAAMVGLLLGPATNLATLGFLQKRYGLRATITTLFWLLAFAWSVGLALNLGLVPIELDPEAIAKSNHTHDLLGPIALSLLGLMAIASLWRGGFARWLEALHDHPHDHTPHTPSQSSRRTAVRAPGESPVLTTSLGSKSRNSAPSSDQGRCRVPRGTT